MRYAVNKVNNNNAELLFGMKAYYRIVDTCRNMLTLSRSFKGNLQSYYMGIIGPTTSDQALLASVVHGAYDAAVVSHSATSQVFDDRQTYFNFFRTVPSDFMQINAIIAILKHFNWTYVSIVYSHGQYGRSGAEQLSRKFIPMGGCIARQREMPMEPKELDYVKVIKDLASATKAKVIVLFTLPQDTSILLAKAEKHHYNKVTWVSSTGWKINSVIPNQAAKGALLLRYKNPISKDFEKYFMNLTLNQNRYAWFKEFWSEVFNCSVGTVGDTRAKCLGNESLHSSTFKLDSGSVYPILTAVDSILCALRNSIIQRCPNQTMPCIRRTLLFTYYFEKGIVSNLNSGNSSCPQFGNSVRMNKYGYYDTGIEIMNFDGNGYNKVGEWFYNDSLSGGLLSMTKLKNMVWNQNSIQASFCSMPCKLGEIKFHGVDGCCFTCKRCSDNAIVLNDTCVECFDYEIPNHDKTNCKKLPTRYMRNVHHAVHFSVICSSVGVAANTVALAVFLKHRKSRIVKAASVELTAFIFAALYICFLSPLTYLVIPSRVICGLQRFIVGISLTSCYTPLMLKINRIYRIFKAAETSIRKPVLVSSKSQVLICLGLLCLQLLLGVMWVVSNAPSITKIIPPRRNEVAVICNSEVFQIGFNLIPALILMIICTFYAYKTRRFPSNFNEALSIFTAMYISCFIWGIFITLIIFLEMDKGKVFALWFTIANFTTVIGFITLICLLGPIIKKLYTQHEIMPEREMFSNASPSPATIHRAQHQEIDVLPSINEAVEHVAVADICLQKRVATKEDCMSP